MKNKKGEDMTSSVVGLGEGKRVQRVNHRPQQAARSNYFKAEQHNLHVAT